MSPFMIDTRPEHRMTRLEALRYAEDWIRAWNGKDLEAVLAGYVANATFRSPRALELIGASEVRGRDALRSYWHEAMQRVGSFDFRLDRIIWDPDSRELAILYLSVRDGTARRACEVIRFDAEERKLSGEALYGSPAFPD